jgi:GNAT superfamily N-acetyltransferase
VPVDLDGVAGLRAAALASCPLFYDHPGAREKIREGLERCTERIVFVHEDRPRAFIGWYHEDEAWCGTPLQSVFIELAPGDQPALEWTRRMIRDVARDLGPDTELQLSPGLAELVPDLLAAGLGIEAVILVGRPVDALRRLNSRPAPPRDLARHGLTVEPLGAEHVAAVVDLWRWTFNAEPQHCWFGTSPGYLARFEQGLLLAAGGEVAGAQLVALESNGAVVGYFETDVEYQPYWGVAAGMSLVLDERYRGRGIASTAYRLLLEAQVELDVDVFKGGTSRPSVMALGTRMGRELAGIMFGRRALFGPEHFEEWV